jgi:hemolysin III
VFSLVGSRRLPFALAFTLGAKTCDGNTGASLNSMESDSGFSGTSSPLLRGWLHAGAGVASIALTIGLCIRSADDTPRLLSMVVYGVSLTVGYLFSAVYHLGTWEPVTLRRLRALDHALIFASIAGVFTPFFVNVLSGSERTILLLGAWAQAITGMICVGATLRLPRWLYTSLYLSMGWVIIVAFPTLISRLPVEAIVLIGLGGLLYALGAAVYAKRKPNPFRTVFGFHEVFHGLVIGASVADAIVIWRWVIPILRS